MNYNTIIKTKRITDLIEKYEKRHSEIMAIPLGTATQKELAELEILVGVRIDLGALLK